MAVRSYRKNKQSGIVIVMTVILLPVFLIMLALIIDLGFAFIAVRQAQNLADMVATASSNLLLKDNAEDVTSVTLSGWQNIKPTAKALSQNIKIIRTDQPDEESDFFDDGQNVTFNDKVNFNTDTMVVSGANGINLTLKIRRGVRCFDNLGSVRFLDLEPYSDYWCLANYVDVSVQVSGFSTFLAPILGVNHFGTFTRTAVGQVRPFPLSCGMPNCSDYDLYLNTSSQPMVPVTPPICYYPPD